MRWRAAWADASSNHERSDASGQLEISREWCERQRQLVVSGVSASERCRLLFNTQARMRKKRLNTKKAAFHSSLPLMA